MPAKQAARDDVTASTPGSTFVINFPRAGVQESFSTGDGSLQAIAADINAKSSRLTATLVRAGGTDANPEFRLSIASKATGSATEFDLVDPEHWRCSCEARRPGWNAQTMRSTAIGAGVACIGMNARPLVAQLLLSLRHAALIGRRRVQAAYKPGVGAFIPKCH